MKFRNIAAGDPAPWFKQRSTSNANYSFDTAAGRYVVLCFLGSATNPAGQHALKGIAANRSLFDDDKICLFGVSVDPKDEKEARIKADMPGIRHFWDMDFQVSRLYGAAPEDLKPGESLGYRPMWIVLDPTLRVMSVLPFAEDGADVRALTTLLRALPPVNMHPGFEIHAPVLVLPNVFEKAFCDHLIGLYEANGGEESGFMREVDGKTVGITDYSHKRRADFLITDEAIVAETQNRIRRRVVPEIRKVHQFTVTRMERYLVGCYDSATGGHFNAHRDNTTKGTAHRRFAVSINLNSEFEGGEVSFPEYGRRSFKPPPGGAVVFSCSLLHAVSQVTAGKRYAFLPFLYDDAAAKLREENIKFLQGGGQYRAEAS
jgi:peroxiredoxin/predicted 2-oxoglutarate/Fe(II)-dependent dioxygenase YbiX